MRASEHLEVPSDLRTVTKIEKYERRNVFDMLRVELSTIEDTFRFERGQADFAWRVSKFMWRAVSILNDEQHDNEQVYRVLVSDFITMSQLTLTQTVRTQDFVLLKHKNLIARNVFVGPYTVAPRWSEHIMAPPILDEQSSPYRMIEGVGYEPPVPEPIQQDYLGISVLQVREDAENMLAVVSSTQHFR